MTVPNENTVDSFTLTGTGQTLNLSYTFLDETHLRVMLNQSEAPLVLNSDYTVTEPAKLGQLGSITMSPGTGIATDVVTVELDPPCTQLTVFRENSRFPAKVNEATHDQAYMLACKAVEAIFGVNGVVIRYPRFEQGNGISPILPVLADRIGDGTGTIVAMNSLGQIDVISKGTLLITLTLSNDSALGGGSPDPVNGGTQRAVKIYIDIEDLLTRTGTGLNADGTFSPYIGARFLNGFDAILAATTQKEGDEILDAVLRTIVDIDLPSLGGRLDDLEASAKVIAQGAASNTGTNLSGTPLQIGTVTLTLPAGRVWTHIRVGVTQRITSLSTIKFSSIKNGTTIQTAKANAMGAITYTTLSDTSLCVSDTIEYLPNDTAITQVINVFYTGSGIGVSAERAIYAVGEHA